MEKNKLPFPSGSMSDISSSIGLPVSGTVVKKDIAQTIAIEYMIDKTPDNRYFVLSAKISINLAKFSINIPRIVLLDKAKIPIPICNQEVSKPASLTWQDRK
jgi:hypothetical protein